MNPNPSANLPGFAGRWTSDTPHKKAAKISVALVDFDAYVDFLPSLASAANAAQTYYDFVVLYLPFPSGVVRFEPYEQAGTEVPRFYLSELEGYLDKSPEQLNVNLVCCLTSGLIADGKNIADEEEYDDLFSAALATNANVFAVSTYGLRDYAKQANTSFAKATLFLCITELMLVDPRWSLACHDETAGCPLDFCDNRDDIVVGLKKMKFNHEGYEGTGKLEDCREKVKDADMLKAIDALLAIEVEL